MRLKSGAALAVFLATWAQAAFQHPGALLTQADLTRIRTNVAAGREPWKSAWAALKNSDAGAGYRASVAAKITDVYALQTDGHAAYVLAIKWAASGDVTYANASKNIINAWTSTVQKPFHESMRNGLGTLQMANAAEILAYGFNGSAGWSPAEAGRAQAWFQAKIWPELKQTDPANMSITGHSSNWGTSCQAGLMAMAIFCDSREIYDSTVSAYKNGFPGVKGCSASTQYIWSPTGQATESGRDQGHAQGGIAHLMETAAMAWNQGENLFTYGGNRVVAGFEYAAKYNLGNAVPYDPAFPDPCDVHPAWPTISATGRGNFSPVYEMANSYFNLAGIPAPYTKQVRDRPGYTPERTNSDHPGLGTLTFYGVTSSVGILERKGLIGSLRPQPASSRIFIFDANGRAWYPTKEALEAGPGRPGNPGQVSGRLLPEPGAVELKGQYIILGR